MVRRVLAHIVRNVVLTFERIRLVVLWEREVLVGVFLVVFEVSVLRLGLGVPHEGLVRRLRRRGGFGGGRGAALRARWLAPRLAAVARLVPVILILWRLRFFLTLLPGICLRSRYTTIKQITL